jgi:hypothetical protein
VSPDRESSAAGPPGGDAARPEDPYPWRHHSTLLVLLGNVPHYMFRPSRGASWVQFAHGSSRRTTRRGPRPGPREGLFPSRTVGRGITVSNGKFSRERDGIQEFRGSPTPLPHDPTWSASIPTSSCILSPPCYRDGGRLRLTPLKPFDTLPSAIFSPILPRLMGCLISLALNGDRIAR